MGGGVDFIKIDTEGHEYKIMKNALSVFQRDNPWIFFEFNSLCLLVWGDSNPKEMLKWVFQNFKYVFRVEKNSIQTGAPLLRQFAPTDLIYLLYENIISHGSVDDFLVTNHESALNEVRDLLKPNPFIKQNLELQKRITALESLTKTNAAQIQTSATQLQQAATAQLEAIKQSRSWRITAPLRACCRFLRRYVH